MSKPRKSSKASPKADPMKTFWLSFCDEDTGENLGVCVVEVTEEIASKAVETAKRMNRDPIGAWVVAAIGMSVFNECNPGGNVEATEIDPAQLPADLPRNKLIQEDELKRRGWA